MDMRKLTKNPTFAGIAGTLVGVIATFLLGEVKYHDAVTYNNISSYIDSLMVKPGMVDEEILSLDNPFEQINMISEVMMEQREVSENTMNNQQASYNNLLIGIRECLISSGKDKSIVDQYTQDELINELADTIESLSVALEENKELETTLQNLKEQKTAILSSPDLRILGEDINTTLTDYVASIDGHTYYSENLLNIFLPEKMTYIDEIVKYGDDVPERINAVSKKRIHDNSELLCYNGDAHFMMGLQEYSSGIVNNWYRSGSLKIACNEEYSQLSFTLGHVDPKIPV